MDLVLGLANVVVVHRVVVVLDLWAFEKDTEVFVAFQMELMVAAVHLVEFQDVEWGMLVTDQI